MFLVRRLTAIAVLLAGLSVGLFGLLAWMPEGPREDAPVAGGHRIQRPDRPVLDRYRCWMVGGPDCRWSRRGLLRGDLGYSAAFREPLGPILRSRLVASALLLGPSLLASVLLSLALGTWMALRAGRLDARALEAVALVGLGIPKHWGALVLLLAVQSTLGLAALHAAPLLWPWIVLVVFYTARWTRYVRGSMREALGSPAVRLARAKGLPEHRVVAHHALKTALVPFVAVVSQSVPVVFSGSVLVESVFSYPGMGLLLLESLRARDHLAAVTVFWAYAAFTFAASLGADLAYRALDPRAAA